MADTTEVVKVQLDNGAVVHIQVTALGGEEEVAFTLPSFHDVTGAIEGIAEAMVSTLKKIKPQRACVEFGIEIALEAGQLTALLIKSSGSSNLKITLEWNDSGTTTP
jgi:plastocyanin domain-containing protein